MKTGKKKGFTLIELVVAIGILGILATIAAPRYFRMITSVRQGADRLSCQNIYKAILMYNASEEKAVVAGEPTLNEIVEAGYIDNPKPQSGTTAFSISYTSDRVTISGGAVSVDFAKP